MKKASSKKILIIEDDEALQRSFGEILGQEGFEVVAAYDGASGLALARREKPDLILLDLILPKKDGFEVLKELKQDVHTKAVPVLVLSVLEGSADIQRAIEAGAESYLVKTEYQLQDIVHKVREVLQR